MSRVIYTETKDTADQELLRTAHQVRIVSSQEEGNSVSALPGGVYGYTYSPGLTGAPLFAVRRFRSFETHKLPSGEVYVIGFAKSDVARSVSTASEEMTLQIHAQPEGEYETLVTIPYARIKQHRQYAAPNQDGFTVTVRP
jgi:hypothetical protein